MENWNCYSKLTQEVSHYFVHFITLPSVEGDYDICKDYVTLILDLLLIKTKQVSFKGLIINIYGWILLCPFIIGKLNYPLSFSALGCFRIQLIQLILNTSDLLLSLDPLGFSDSLLLSLSN